MTTHLFHRLKCPVLLFLFSLTMIPVTLLAQHNEDLDSIEARVDEIFAPCNKPGVPGAAIAILSNGRVILSKGYGIAQLEYNIPITTTTVFRVASMSKQFTAMGITLLEMEGRLSIDEDIHEYLPEFPHFEEPITIRHLLHHTSGLRDDLSLWVLAGNHIEDVITQEDLLSLARRQKRLNFTPGSQYGYSDTNYDLLAEIVSSVTGESFSTWLENNLFVPLGMTSSCFVDDYARLVNNRAYCYEPRDSGGFKNVLLSMGWVGSSGLHTNAEDMIKWLNNLETREVFGDKVYDAMLTQGMLNDGKQITYARGVNVDTYNDHKVIRHSGTNGAFFCHMSYFPDDRLGVVILTNFPSNPWDTCNAVADLFLLTRSDKSSEGDGYENTPSSRTKPATVELTRDDLAACVGTYWYENSWAWLLRDVVIENNKLYYVRSADDRAELIPISTREFLLDGTDTTIVRFSAQDNSRFTDLTFDATGREPKKAVRVERFQSRYHELKEYEGLYYTEELDALHRLVVRSGKLFNVKFRLDPDTPWTPIVEDRFTFFDREAHVTFRRDDRGRVTGYVLDFPRAEHIVFQKLD